MRRTHDFYETPEYYVTQLLQDVTPRGRIYEPCVGDHAIARLFPGCETNDIDPSRLADSHTDASLPWDGERYDWVITNPPFSKAQSILEQALDRADAVAMLLRISFFEPTKARESLLVSNPPSGLIYLPRYSFTGDGKSDSTTVVWGVWLSGNEWREQWVRIAPRFP